MSSDVVESREQPEVRITTASGSITVVAEPRDDVVADDSVDVRRAHDGSTEVVPRKRSRSMTVRCPEGAAVVVGTRSGSLKLAGSFGAVRVTTMSGSITVDRATSVDARAMSGKIVVGTCTGSCRVKTKSGSTRVSSAGSVEIHLGSGSIQVDHVDGAAAVRAVSGSVTVEAGGAGPVEVETMSGSVTIVLPASCQPRVKARSLSSRPRIECSQGNDCDVTVRTLSGGITVKCR